MTNASDRAGPLHGAPRIEVHPATTERFDDVISVLAPKKPDAPVCWCLSYRIPNQEYKTLTGPERPARLRRYAEEGTPPGVIAYVDGEPAGWCSVSPRASHHRLTHSRTIANVDDRPVWSVICFVVRAPFRQQGLSRHMLAGAIEYARSRGAPMLEAYPIEAAGKRVSQTLAYVGTTALFESIGFERITETSARSGGARRWLMRLDLTT